MRRVAGILLIAAFAVAPLAADLTITTVTTIEGALAANAPGGMSPKVLVRISGTKSRMDVETGDQTIVTISDSATNQAYLLKPEEKTAQLLRTDLAAAPESAATVAPKVDATVTPTGQKREINGQSCDEYAVAMKLDLASMLAPMAGGGATPPEAASMLNGVILNITGSIWTAKDAPGAAEYVAFQKDAARIALAMGRSSLGTGATSIPSGMDRLLTGFHEAAGIPYLTELTTKLEGTGQLVALMQQMGQMKINGKVTSVSTEPVSTDIFAVPDGYTILK